LHSPRTKRADDRRIPRSYAEEEFGFNATPYVATGKFVKILGL
jgi:hypothetical protein